MTGEAVKRTARRRAIVDVLRQEAVLGLTGWLTGNQFDVGWNGRTLDPPALIGVAADVLPNVSKIGLMEPATGAALTVVAQLLKASSMGATAEEVSAALAPFRDHLDVIAVKRQGMTVLSVGVVFADGLTPEDARTRITACFDYSAALARVMLAHGPLSALNMGLVMDVLLVFFDSDQFAQAQDWAVDLYEERQGRLVSATLIDWIGRTMQFPAPDTFAGRVRVAIGTEVPIYGTEDDDVARRHVAAWHERIAAGASTGSAPVRLVDHEKSFVIDLPRPGDLKNTVTKLGTGGMIEVTRLDRRAALVAERVGRGWKLTLHNSTNAGAFQTSVRTVDQVLAALTAYRAGDLQLNHLDWRLEPG